MKVWGLVLAALLVILAAAFPDVVSGRLTVDGAARLPETDGLYPRPPARAPERIPDLSNECAHQPWDMWIHRSLARGEAPLWAPEMGLGTPLLGNGQSAPFSPFKLVTQGPAGGAWGPAFVLGRLVLAGVGLAALAGYLGLSPWAGLLGGTAFMLHAYFLSHLRYSELHVYAFLPWLLIAAERLRRRPDARGVGLFGLGIGLLGLLGHPEPAIYSAVAAGLAYGLGVLADEGAVRPALARLAMAVALGGLLAAVIVLPFAEFVLNSTSYIFGSRSAFSSGFGHVLFASAVHLLTPVGPTALYDAYVGIAPALLAVLGLRDARVRPHAAALVGFAAFCYAAFPPNNLLPTLPLAPNSFYAAPLVACGLALLAAAGLDQLREGLPRRPVATLGGVAAALAIAVGASPWLLVGQPLGDLRGAAGFLAAAAALLLAHAARAWPGWAIASALVALTAVDMAAAVAAVVTPMPAFRYPETPILKYLKHQPGVFRVNAAGAALKANTNMVHGIQSLRVMDAFLLRRYIGYYDAVLPAWSPTGFQPDLLDLANVRYMVVADSRVTDAIRARLDADPVRYPVRLRQDRVALYENTTAMPRARVVHAAEFQRAGWREAAPRLAATPERWRDVALVETPDGRPPAGWADGPGPATPATIARYTPQEVAVAAKAERPGMLVLADAYYPGWEAQVDGRPAPIYAVDLAFRGVPVEAGTHEVVFRYRPWTFRVGLALSLMALLIGLLLIARRPAPRPAA